MKSCTVTIRKASNGRAVFQLVFYGLDQSDFMIIPGGAYPVTRALERRGLDPREYATTLLDIHEGRPTN